MKINKDKFKVLIGDFNISGLKKKVSSVADHSQMNNIYIKCIIDEITNNASIGSIIVVLVSVMHLIQLALLYSDIYTSNSKGEFSIINNRWTSVNHIIVIMITVIILLLSFLYLIGIKTGIAYIMGFYYEIILYVLMNSTRGEAHTDIRLSSSGILFRNIIIILVIYYLIRLFEEYLLRITFIKRIFEIKLNTSQK